MTETDVQASASAVVGIVERIMTQHWDLAACRCWVCEEGRAAGCRPREPYLSHHGDTRPRVTVEESRAGGGRD